MEGEGGEVDKQGVETDPEDGGEEVKEVVAEEEISGLNHQRHQMEQKLWCSRWQAWDLRAQTFMHLQSTMLKEGLNMNSHQGSHFSHHLKEETHGTEILVLSQIIILSPGH